MTYPYFRKKSSLDGKLTSYLYFKDSGVIGKLQANDTAYVYNGPYNGSLTEDELIAVSEEITVETWAAGVEDNANMAERVGGRPVIRPPH